MQQVKQALAQEKKKRKRDKIGFWEWNCGRGGRNGIKGGGGVPFFFIIKRASSHILHINKIGKWLAIAMWESYKCLFFILFIIILGCVCEC